LREFLGAKAGRLKVTYLAKWKTTAQMVAIPVLLLAGVFDYDRRRGAPWISAWFHNWAEWVLQNGGLVLIWVAGC
jgi:phosphatidylglycerophosphate synthase